MFELRIRCYQVVTTISLCCWLHISAVIIFRNQEVCGFQNLHRALTHSGRQRNLSGKFACVSIWPIYAHGLCNSSLSGRNGSHFADDIFRCIFVNEKFCILTKMSLKYIPTGLIIQQPSIGLDNGLASKRRKPLSEPMLTQFTADLIYTPAVIVCYRLIIPVHLY